MSCNEISNKVTNFLHQIICNAELISNHDENLKITERIKEIAYNIDALISDATVIKPKINITKNDINIHRFSNLNILIVDDLIENREIMENIFSTMSCTITSAKSGEEAIKIYKEGFHPDIICMDIIMTGIDGVSTTKELKRLGSKAYFIAISALKNQPNNITSLFNFWLQKPFTLEHILTALSGYKTNQNIYHQKTFKINSEIPNEIKKDIIYLSENKSYTLLKNLINTLEDSKSKKILTSLLKELDFKTIKESMI